MKTTVRNLEKVGEEIEYSSKPREAVIAAYAQRRGDWNTWDYEHRYGTLAQKTEHGWSCGEFWARNSG